jgi:hypothetical protein
MFLFLAFFIFNISSHFYLFTVNLMDFYYTSFSPAILALKQHTRGGLDAVIHLYEKNPFISSRDRLLVSVYLLIDTEVRDLSYFMSKKSTFENCYYFSGLTSTHFDGAIAKTNESLDYLHFLAKVLCKSAPKPNVVRTLNCKRLARHTDANFVIALLLHSDFIDSAKRNYWVRFFRSVKETSEHICSEKLNDFNPLLATNRCETCGKTQCATITSSSCGYDIADGAERSGEETTDGGSEDLGESMHTT